MCGDWMILDQFPYWTSSIKYSTDGILAVISTASCLIGQYILREQEIIACFNAVQLYE